MARFILDGVFEGTIRRVGDAAGSSCVAALGTVLVGGLVAYFAIGMALNASWLYLQHNVLDSDQCPASPGLARQESVSFEGIVNIEGCEVIEITGAANVQRRVAIGEWSGLFDREKAIEWLEGRADDMSMVTGQEVPRRLAGDYSSELYNDGGPDVIYAAVRVAEGADPELVKVFDISVSRDGSKTTIQPDPEGFERIRLGRLSLKTYEQQ